MEGFRPVLRRAVWPRLACVVLALATVLGPAAPARAWTTKVAGEVGEYDDAPLVARDPAGDLLAADLGYLASVTKYDGRSGAVLWRVDGPGDDASYDGSIAADPRGDALIGLAPAAAVVKLSGADGHALWRYEDDSGLRYPLPLLVDGNGDALFVCDAGDAVVVTKVSGASGALLWRARPASSGSFNITYAAAIDAHGDVVIGTSLYEAGSSRTVMLKVSGTDGRLLWSTSLDGDSYVAGVAFDASGDVLVGATVYAGVDPLSVVLAVKLDGATGAVRWRDATLPGSTFAIAVDPEDGLVVGGKDFVGSVVTHWNAGGARTWSRPIGAPDREFAVDGVVAVGGRIVVGGTVKNSPTLAGFAVHGLDATDGSEVWQIERQSDGPLVRLSGFGGTPALVPDGAGGVVVSAWFLDADSFTDAVLVNVGLADGSERWAVDFDTSSRGVNDGAASLELDSQGDLVAGGLFASAASGWRAAAVKLSREDGHVLWQSVVDAMDGSGRAVVGPAGEVFVPGTVKTGPYAPYGSIASTEMGPQPRAPDGLAAVKLSGADGHELWRWVESDGNGYSVMGRSAVDAAGNLLANVDRLGALQIVKLDGATGTPLWFGPTASLPTFDPNTHETAPIAVDAADDVIASANAGPWSFRQTVTVKLRGADGTRLWATRMPDGVIATAMALDAHGDAVIGASSFVWAYGTSDARLVQKLVGATGAVVWTRQLGPGDVGDVVIDSAGDVIVAGWAGGYVGNGALSVVKLDGDTGEVVWSVRGPAETPGLANAVTVNEAGDVFVAGRLVVSGESRFAMVALRGTDGAARWTRTYANGGDAVSEARDIVLDGAGRAVGAGSVFGSEETLLDFAVVSLDAATGRDGACGSQRSCGSGPTLRVPTSGRGRLPQR
ncbi:MAG: PQQ-binding-like beta-propeller repeat protein [Candidatus Binatia bacterium]